MPRAGFEIRVQREARDQLAALDPSIGVRVRYKIEWLAEHADSIRHRALTHDLAGLFKLRVGDYRVVYELVRDRRILVIHRVGHRTEIYDVS